MSEDGLSSSDELLAGHARNSHRIAGQFIERTIDRSFLATKVVERFKQSNMQGSPSNQKEQTIKN